MFLHVARAHRGPLFQSPFEAAALWRLLLRSVPGLVAVCLLPRELHVLTAAAAGARTAAFMSAYARWRNAQRVIYGRVWAGPAEVVRVLPADAVATERRLHLAAAEAGLVADPLEWPWSTWRDRMGVAAEPVGPEPEDLEVLYAETCGRSGAGPPRVRVAVHSYDAVVDAVCGAMRTPREGVDRRGRVRELVWATAGAHVVSTAAELAVLTNAQLKSVVRGMRDAPGRCEAIEDRALAACVRAVGDPRIRPLVGGREPHPYPEDDDGEGPARALPRRVLPPSRWAVSDVAHADGARVEGVPR